ncbi:MAG: hypothetical protein ABI234_17850 [Ktedonobacteraceae bacterium]
MVYRLCFLDVCADVIKQHECTHERDGDVLTPSNQVKPQRKAGRPGWQRKTRRGLLQEAINQRLKLGKVDGPGAAVGVLQEVGQWARCIIGRDACNIAGTLRRVQPMPKRVHFDGIRVYLFHRNSFKYR